MTKDLQKRKRNIMLTDAQCELLELINPRDSADIHHALREIHSLGTYHLESRDLINLNASKQIQILIDAIGKISQEHLISKEIQSMQESN